MSFKRTRKALLFAVVGATFALLPAFAAAQQVINPDHLKPNGKGWGEEKKDGDEGPDNKATKAARGTSGNGILYHGGPVLKANPVPVYFIWYGNWSNGPSASDSTASVSLLESLFSASGLNDSGYEKINSTYTDGSGAVSGGVERSLSTFDSYSHGISLSDAAIEAIVSGAIANGSLPKDTNGLYFVLTSSDVNETSGFCTRYCGWHTSGTISGSDIKYAFVGNPDRCPNACEAQTTSPNGNSGADGMASIMAHESEEAISDPDLNAWYDQRGEENADKCAWKFGPLKTASNGSAYNQTLAGRNWLIQMNWENKNGGGCEQVLGGPFFTQ